VYRKVVLRDIANNYPFGVKQQTFTCDNVR